MDFDFDSDLDLALDLIWLGSGLISVGFGLVFCCIWLRSALALGPSQLSQLSSALLGGPGRSLGKVTKVTGATRVIRCIIEHKIDHPAP